MPESRLARALTWAKYNGVSVLIHQPRLLRLLSRALRRHAWLSHLAKIVASRHDVVTTFQRPHSFSSTAHRPNLVAGDFAIGMESGPRHSAERKLLRSKLPAATEFAQYADDEGTKLIKTLREGPARTFDLVEEYMVPLAWQAMSRAFGNLLPPIPRGDPMFMDLRYVGAHLIAGAVATEKVQARAMESAARLNAWVRSNIAGLQQDWSAGGWAGPVRPVSREAVARNVVGLLWVGHPATVQSGALLVQEIFAQRWNRELRDLVKKIQQDSAPWTSTTLRSEVRRHVLELLRLRPPFPILHRDVPRDTLYGAEGRGAIAGGSVLTMFTIGAMSDPAAMTGLRPCKYDPNRQFKDPGDLHFMFGQGPRPCIAQEQVVEILTSALLGLLQLPGLTWADPWWRRVCYDGPMIRELRVRFR